MYIEIAKVMCKYNNGQTVFYATYNESMNKIRITEFETDEDEYIGFYEWIFNPKYKVFEVFGILGADLLYTDNTESIPEIIDSFNKQCEGDNAQK